MALRAVCFDLWETLVADHPGDGDARAADRLQRIDDGLRLAGWPAPPEAIAGALQATVDSLVTIHQDNRDIDAEERIALFFRHLDPSLRPEQHLAADGHAQIISAIRDGALRVPPALLPGAAHTLDNLRRHGLRLALVSNSGFSPGDVLRTVLDRLDIGKYFATQVYSDEVGAWKPDARMFDEALFALGVAPADTLFVGDRPTADIVGAQAFGIGMTALVGERSLPGVQPTFDLPDIQALLPALRDRGVLPAAP
jgi:putative hydrolase of the HAD superfamily